MVPKSGGVQSSVDAVHQKGGNEKVGLHLEMPPEGNLPHYIFNNRKLPVVRSET